MLLHDGHGSSGRLLTVSIISSFRFGDDASAGDAVKDPKIASGSFEEVGILFYK